MTLVFVYGALKRGFSQYNGLKLREQASFKGMASLPGATMYDEGSFPSVVLSGTATVHGELFDIPAGMLSQVDAAHPGFEKIQRSVTVEGRPVVCWMYVKRVTPKAAVVNLGRWTKQ